MRASEEAILWCELRELFDHDQARLWMQALQPRLGYRSPRDCAFDEVMRIIDQLKSGAFI